MRFATDGAWLAVVATVIAGGATVAAAGSRSSWHEDARYGYALKPPKDWTEIPIRTGEDWLVAKYLSDRTYFWTDDIQGWTWEHRPELMVVAFLDDELRRALAGEDDEDADDDEPDDEPKIKTKPYEDYEDFLDRTYVGGGFHVHSRETEERRGLAITKYSIKVEKLARTGPKRISTWVYHTDGIDLAVQFEVLEDEYDKLERMLERTHRSFKIIPRTLAGVGGDASTLPAYISIQSMNEGAPEERKVKRLESQQRIHDEALATLADDWTHDEIGHFLVLNHSDERYAERIAEQGDMVIEWLEEMFEFVGPEEYVRKPILRICADDDEERSFARGRVSGTSGAWYGIGLEIITHKDDMGFQDGYETGYVNRRVLTHWFQERDRRLYYAMPTWLRYGLQEYVEEARAGRRSLEFREDEWERDRLRTLVRNGQARPPRELIRMTSSEVSGSDSTWNEMEQGAALVRFLLSGPGQRSKMTRTLIPDYLAALDQVLDEIEAEEDDDDLPKPTNEEEEEAYYKQRQERWKKREREINDRTFQRVFRGWKDRDWKRFDKAYFNEVG